MKNKGKCTLAINFQEYEKKEALWLEEREIKGNLYQAFSDYIVFLQRKLSQEDNDYQKYLIKQKIKILRKEMRKHEIKSILASAKYNLELEEDKFDRGTSNSSFLTRKKVK